MKFQRKLGLEHLSPMYGGGIHLVVDLGIAPFAGAETVLCFVTWTPWGGLTRRWVR